MEIFGKIEEREDKDIKVMIYDFSGKEMYFDTVVKPLLPKIDHFVFVYDCSERPSFEAVAQWYEKIKKAKGGSSFKALLVSNKQDFNKKKVGREEGQSAADEHRSGYIETSVKSYSDVEKVFTYFIK